jgi:hypothetical protein
MTIGRLIIAAALMLTAFLPSPRAETLLGSTVSEEVFLYMKVNPEAAQALLPEGWTLAPWTKGAWAGANLLIILGEIHSDLDPEGKPRRDAGYLNMRLFTWGRSETVIDHAVEQVPPQPVDHPDLRRGWLRRRDRPGRDIGDFAVAVHE